MGQRSPEELSDWEPGYEQVLGSFRPSAPPIQEYATGILQAVIDELRSVVETLNAAIVVLDDSD